MPYIKYLIDIAFNTIYVYSKSCTNSSSWSTEKWKVKCRLDEDWYTGTDGGTLYFFDRNSDYTIMHCFQWLDDDFSNSHRDWYELRKLIIDTFFLTKSVEIINRLVFIRKKFLFLFFFIVIFRTENKNFSWNIVDIFPAAYLFLLCD